MRSETSDREKKSSGSIHRKRDRVWRNNSHGKMAAIVTILQPKKSLAKSKNGRRSLVILYHRETAQNK